MILWVNDTEGKIRQLVTRNPVGPIQSQTNGKMSSSFSFITVLTQQGHFEDGKVFANLVQVFEITI